MRPSDALWLLRACAPWGRFEIDVEGNPLGFVAELHRVVGLDRDGWCAEIRRLEHRGHVEREILRVPGCRPVRWLAFPRVLQEVA